MANVDLRKTKRKLGDADRIRRDVKELRESVLQNKPTTATPVKKSRPQFYVPQKKLDMGSDIVPVLPQIMRDATNELYKKKSISYEMSVIMQLSFMNMVATPHYDVTNFGEWSDGHVPLSLWFVQLQDASGGKSGSFSIYKKPIDEYNALHFSAQYDADKDEYDAAMKKYKKDMNTYIEEREVNDHAERPERPVPPVNYDPFVENATLNGIGRRFKSTSLVALFTPEGSKYMNSHDSRTDETASMMKSSECDLWSGGFMSKQTGEEEYNHVGRRYCMSILVQPEHAAKLVNNEAFVSSGYDSRMLISTAPPFYVNEDATKRKKRQNADISGFITRMMQLYAKPKRTMPNVPFVLNPEIIEFTDDAEAYFDHVYEEIHKQRNKATKRKINNEPREAGDSLVGKGVEQFLRLAGTLAVADGNEKVEVENAHAAWLLFSYFLQERIGLEEKAGVGTVSIRKKLQDSILDVLIKEKAKNGASGGWVYISKLTDRRKFISEFDQKFINDIVESLSKAGTIERNGKQIRFV